MFAKSLIEPMKEFFNQPDYEEVLNETKSRMVKIEKKNNEIANEIEKTIMLSDENRLQIKNNVLYYIRNNNAETKELNYIEEEIWDAISNKKQFKFKNLYDKGVEIILLTK